MEGILIMGQDRLFVEQERRHRMQSYRVRYPGEFLELQPSLSHPHSCILKLCCLHRGLKVNNCQDELRPYKMGNTRKELGN